MMLGTAKKRAPEGQPIAGWWRRYFGLIVDGLLVFAVGSLAGLAIAGVAADALYDAFMKTKEQSTGKAAVLLQKLQDGTLPDPQTALDSAAGREIGQNFSNNLSLNFGQWAVLIAAILLFLLFVFYNNIMRVHTKGRTLGDQLVGIYKIKGNTSWLSWGQAILRYLLILVLAWGSGLGGSGTTSLLTIVGTILGVLYLVNYLLPLFDNRGQTIVDKIVRSFVVHPDRFGVAMHAQQPPASEESDWPGAGVYDGIENENPYVAAYPAGVAGQPPASVSSDAAAASAAAGAGAAAGVTSATTALPEAPGGFAPADKPAGEAVTLPKGPSFSGGGAPGVADAGASAAAGAGAGVSGSGAAEDHQATTALPTSGDDLAPAKNTTDDAGQGTPDHTSGTADGTANGTTDGDSGKA